jgi:CBS domain-containing protein
MRTKDLMSQPVVTCPIDETLDAAARLMWEHDCGIVPVVGDDGRLRGVVTDRDICIAAYSQGRPLRHISVSIAMAKQVVAVHEDDSIETAERLMADNQVRRLPVLDGTGRPVGLVSMNDLARAAGHAKRSATDRELVETLAAICEPHGRRPARPDRLPAVVS